MKKFVWILFALLIQMTACENSTINPNLLQGKWNVVHQFQDIYTFRAMFFADQNNGWIIGQLGKVVSTTDGGNSWKFQNSGTTEDLFSVYFYNLENGWIVGRNNTVIQSSNRGMKWEKVNIDQDTSQTFYHVSFTDNNNGWILSNHGKVFKTEDSGKTWQLRLIWDAGGAGMIHFINDEIGFIIPAIGNQLYRTSDGGLNWMIKPINIDMSWERDMFFIDQSLGWICNDRSPSSKAVDYASIFRTKDGGENWESVHTFDESYLMKLYFLDRNNGWVVGRKIFYTFDGGDTWVCQLNGTSSLFTDIQFVDSSIGYALEFGGAIYKFQPNYLY
jgi:photosystem II stability/assembly factor-like uncharacterized protein